MSATLLVLAAGMASRYGSLKQIDKFGPSGESIIDYSIYDAIEAGFTRVVFVIRKDFADEVKQIFEPRLAHRIKTDYVFQEVDTHTDTFTIPAIRSKPWGTGHAVLCARNVINEPFAVINADDFYGKDAFKKAYKFLSDQVSSILWANICYELNNTLSDYGPVSRGICETDNNSSITSVRELLKVYKQDGRIISEENGQLHVWSANAKTSMNFWCFSPAVFDFSGELFHEFLTKHIQDPKSEFFISFVGDEFIKQGRGKINAIVTSEKWFGVTYKADKQIVQNCINRLTGENAYPSSLWDSSL
ncbi:MAG TPA: sugar phosphate nucleotidyltransferase [Chitinophagaceae bacterium]|jgi:NDP-sugar pyrophosphorylase family protein|nr:sugar phosphate nucleotidyltransferase [Chitinophagaceae bacterium]HMU57243.1 sugar phosphate nucleotidyltransferase [Chitinophagaceae bacterium]